MGWENFSSNNTIFFLHTHNTHNTPTHTTPHHHPPSARRPQQQHVEFVKDAASVAEIFNEHRREPTTAGGGDDCLPLRRLSEMQEKRQSIHKGAIRVIRKSKQQQPVAAGMSMTVSGGRGDIHGAAVYVLCLCFSTVMLFSLLTYLSPCLPYTHHSPPA